MNPMLHRLLRKDREKTDKVATGRPEASGCLGILLALSLAAAVALLAVLSA
jgi:hypothetical protein